MGFYCCNFCSHCRRSRDLCKCISGSCWLYCWWYHNIVQRNAIVLWSDVLLWHFPGNEHAHSHLGQSNTHSHSHSHDTQHTHGGSKPARVSEFDIDKVRSTLKQFTRDWGAEVSILITNSIAINWRILTICVWKGKRERDACYQPMLEALLRHFGNVSEANR